MGQSASFCGYEVRLSWSVFARSPSPILPLTHVYVEVERLFCAFETQWVLRGHAKGLSACDVGRGGSGADPDGCDAREARRPLVCVDAHARHLETLNARR